jgi:hypothetical protein
MRLLTQTSGQRGRRSSGLTLLEIMVTVTLLTVIVLGLYAMFDQTQDALRKGTTQVDVLETSRAVSELLKREFEQAQAAGVPRWGTLGPARTNLWIDSSPGSQPITNLLLDGSARVTQMDHVYFLTKARDWRVTGYIVGTLPPGAPQDQVLFSNGVGALFRYQTRASDPTNNRNLDLPALSLELEEIEPFNAYWTNYQTATNFTLPSYPDYLLTNFNLVAAGIVSFNVRAFGTIVGANGIPTNGVLLSTSYPFLMTNEHLPDFLEVELGILEPQALEQARALAFTNNPGLSRAYLTNSTHRIHIFRQRIPIRAHL